MAITLLLASQFKMSYEIVKTGNRFKNRLTGSMPSNAAQALFYFNVQ